MHGGAAGSGAPLWNKNAFKHGLYTKDTIDTRRAVRAILRRSRDLLQELK
jgi:hypothetical protein